MLSMFVIFFFTHNRKDGNKEKKYDHHIQNVLKTLEYLSYNPTMVPIKNSEGQLINALIVASII